MRRIGFAVVLAVSVLAPLFGEAQEATKVYRIGWLSTAGGPRTTFREALRELRYIEGQTFMFETRAAEDQLDRLPRLAAELVRSKVDIIAAVSLPAIRAASQATSTIPIVMAFGGAGLIESGIVASLAHPGGNVTGVHLLASEIDGKRLELLSQAVPKARKIAVLNPRLGYLFNEVEEVARAVRVQLDIVEVPPGLEGYNRAFDAIVKARADALLVPASPRFARDARTIIELAARRRVPAMYEWGRMAKAGGLIAYGPSPMDLDRRAAAYVDISKHVGRVNRESIVIDAVAA
jgi:ABC-type uncharacterized transport system substrate-binding protein